MLTIRRKNGMLHISLFNMTVEKGLKLIEWEYPETCLDTAMAKIENELKRMGFSSSSKNWEGGNEFPLGNDFSYKR